MKIKKIITIIFLLASGILLFVMIRDGQNNNEFNNVYTPDLTKYRKHPGAK